MFKWQICCTEITNLLQFTTDVQKSHCQLQCTLQLIFENRVLFIKSSCLCFFMRTATSKMQLSSSCAFTFLLLFIQPNSKNLMLQGRGMDEECTPDSNSSKRITIQNYTFFSQKLILLPSKILTFLPESPCIRYHCTKFSCHSDLPPGIGVFLIMTVCEWKCKSTPSPEQQRQKQYPEDTSRLQENQETVFRSNHKHRSQWSKINDVYDIQGSSLLRCDVSLDN